MRHYLYTFELLSIIFGNVRVISNNNNIHTKFDVYTKGRYQNFEQYLVLIKSNINAHESERVISTYNIININHSGPEINFLSISCQEILRAHYPGGI